VPILHTLQVINQQSSLKELNSQAKLGRLSEKHKERERKTPEGAFLGFRQLKG
jgi:hypothetical protein